jgi:hypothetical protein
MLQSDGHEFFDALSHFMKRGGYDFYYYALNAKDKEHTDVPLSHKNEKQLEML